MTNQPFALTESEIKEIASMHAMQEMWAAENSEDMQEILTSSASMVRFDFHSGCPGYVGDLFLVQGDCVVDEPVRMVQSPGLRNSPICGLYWGKARSSCASRHVYISCQTRSEL